MRLTSGSGACGEIFAHVPAWPARLRQLQRALRPERMPRFRDAKAGELLGRGVVEDEVPRAIACGLPDVEADVLAAGCLVPHGEGKAAPVRSNQVAAAVDGVDAVRHDGARRYLYGALALAQLCVLFVTANRNCGSTESCEHVRLGHV